MKLTVVGTGYVGLVSGTCFSEVGNDVVCIDNQSDKIEALKNGDIPIYEPGLEDLVKKNVKADRLTFSTDLAAHVNDSDVIFIAVGTPSNDEGAANLSYVYRVAAEIGQAINHDYKIVVNKSTVPIGTAEEVKAVINEENTAANVDVCSVPEFLREGSAVHDTFNPDRIVIGSSSKHAEATMLRLHEPFSDQVVSTDVRSSEMIKYASNAFLAMKISFINEIANICDSYDADVAAVARGIGLDHRIGPKFLNAGIGYGGSCFPKDVRALIHMARSQNYEPQILKAVEDVNNNQSKRVIDHLHRVFNDDVSNMTFAVLGLTFKPNTDDMRDAPSIKIIRELIEQGAHVRAYDPIVDENVKNHISDQMDLADSTESALDKADAAIVITDWDEFKALTPVTFKEQLAKPIVIDGRNIFDPKDMKEQGLIYHGIGRH